MNKGKINVKWVGHCAWIVIFLSLLGILANIFSDNYRYDRYLFIMIGSIATFIRHISKL